MNRKVGGSLCPRGSLYPTFPSSVPAEARAPYEAKLDRWVRDGWLCEYDEE